MPPGLSPASSAAAHNDAGRIITPALARPSHEAGVQQFEDRLQQQPVPMHLRTPALRRQQSIHGGTGEHDHDKHSGQEQDEEQERSLSPAEMNIRYLRKDPCCESLGNPCC